MKDDFRDRSHLTTIDGDRPEGRPRAGRRRAMQDDEQIVCWKCAQAIGLETSAFVEVRLAPRRKPDGKVVAGTKKLACVYCISRGDLTTFPLK